MKRSFYVYSLEKNTAKKTIKETHVGTYPTLIQAKKEANLRLQQLESVRKRLVPSPLATVKIHVEVREILYDSRKEN